MNLKVSTGYFGITDIELTNDKGENILPKLPELSIKRVLVELSATEKPKVIFECEPINFRLDAPDIQNLLVELLQKP